MITNKPEPLELEIECNTEQIDEAIKKADDLAEALELPKLVIRSCRNCTFNITIGGQP